MSIIIATLEKFICFVVQHKAYIGAKVLELDKYISTYSFWLVDTNYCTREKEKVSLISQVLFST